MGDRDFTKKEKLIIELAKYSKKFIRFDDVYPLIFKNREYAQNSIEVLVQRKILKFSEPFIWESLVYIDDIKIERKE